MRGKTPGGLDALKLSGRAGAKMEKFCEGRRGKAVQNEMRRRGRAREKIRRVEKRGGGGGKETELTVCSLARQTSLSEPCAEREALWYFSGDFAWRVTSRGEPARRGGSVLAEENEQGVSCSVPLQRLDP